jgi:hypothetical protein
MGHRFFMDFFLFAAHAGKQNLPGSGYRTQTEGLEL